MSKIGSVLSGIVSRRCYGVHARAVINTRASSDAAARSDGAALAAPAPAKKDACSWMRDPKTGWWAPENRPADEVDAVDLRNRLLNRK